jgi:hypothetical protein
MKRALQLLFALCLLPVLAACSSPEGLVGGVMTAAVATLLPVNTSIPPTQTPMLATPTPFVPVAVVITAVVNANYAEHVVIQNQDTVVADMTGWRLVETDGEVLPFAFPDGFTLAPGAEVRIYSGRDGRLNNPPEAFEWTELNVWDNKGEKATLLNPLGEPASTLKYP